MGNYFNAFLTVTFVLVAAGISGFLFVNIDRDYWVQDPNKICGPFPDGVSVISAANFFKTEISTS